MSGDTFPAWITTNALSASGIEFRHVRHSPYAGVAEWDGRYKGNYVKPDDWHLTRAAAVARAEDMRAAAIIELERRLAKLRAMDFSTEPKP